MVAKHKNLDIQNIIQIIENPKCLELATLKELKRVVNTYPYFQSARAVYLKTLKDQKSFKYNNELKITAAYTTDRTVLFDFITSDIFNQNEIASEEKRVTTLKDVTNDKDSLEITKAKEKLEIGKPLLFHKNEKHSFAQWLRLSANNPIDREQKPKERTLTTKDKKLLQDSIIEQFIASNPKISKIDKTASYEVKVDEMEQQPQLMTETLAKVYLEQKKYGNAVKAYEILSLKYPEKSGFFADQIKQIRILQNNR